MLLLNCKFYCIVGDKSFSAADRSFSAAAAM